MQGMLASILWGTIFDTITQELSITNPVANWAHDGPEVLFWAVDHTLYCWHPLHNVEPLVVVEDEYLNNYSAVVRDCCFNCR